MTKYRRAPNPSLSALVIALLGLAFPAMARQQQPSQAQPLPAPSQSVEKKNDDPENKTNEETGTTNQRLFGVLPNFLTVENAKNTPLLTSGQKYKLVARVSFDAVEYPYVGFLALISQAEDSEPGFGQGAKGYGKRYGASFADNTVASFMTGAILPSILHEDPRYYQLGKGGFTRRAGYSLSRIFITRSDSGRNEFNFSEIAGNAMMAGISNAYHPASDRTVGNTMSVWWTQILWDAVANEAREFWPDIHRKLRKK